MTTIDHALQGRAAAFGVATAAFALVVACAPLTAPGEATVEVPLQGYPGDGVPTVSTWPEGASPVVTPNPDEVLRVGDFQAQTGPATDRFSYTLRAEQFKPESRDSAYSRLIVEVNGKPVQMGDDFGSTRLMAQDAGWIVWKYEGFGDRETKLSTGLYAYEVTTGETQPVALGQQVAFAQVSDGRVLYTDEAGLEGSRPGYGNRPSDASFPLFVYDLREKTTNQLSKAIPRLLPFVPNSFYDLSGDRAVWIEWNADTQTYVMQIHRFSDGVTQPIDVKLTEPRYLSMAGDLLVWKDVYWHGYSLSAAALFTIPYAPEKYLNNPRVTVSAIDGGVQWRVQPDEGTQEVVFFSASVLLK